MSSPSSSSSKKVWWLNQYRIRIQIIFVAFLAILFGLFYTSNPLLYTNYHDNNTMVIKQKQQFNSKYYSIQQNDQMDIIFDLYQSYFPTTTHDDNNTNELLAYKNHCLRVLSLSVYYYISQNNNTDTTEDRYQHLIDLAAIALAYHDLALWVTIQEQEQLDSSETTTITSTKTKQPIGRLDYLNPSVELFLYDQEMLRTSTSTTTTSTTDMNQNQAVIIPAIKLVSDFESSMIIEMIQQHHKFTTWKYQNNNNNTTKYSPSEIQQLELFVNAIRCGDWMDATMGMIVPWGCNNKNNQNNNDSRIVTNTRIDYLDYLYSHLYPYQFHQMLLLFLSKLSPTSYIGRLQILRILKW
jgi:hypothetical protein